MRSHLPIALLVLAAACGRLSASEGSGSSEATNSASEETSATSDDGSDDDDCGGFSIVPILIPSHIVFVVDVSSSMLESWDHDEDPMTPSVSRWYSARSLLEQLLPELDDRKWLGLQCAPSVDADADVCLVGATPEIEIGEAHGAQILAALPDGSGSPLEIVGGTPLRAAYLSARDHLLAQPEENPKTIALITDGGANCSEPSLPEAVEVFDDGLAAIVEEGLLVHGIWTVVVGVGVDEGQPSLPAQPDSPAIDTHAALNDLALAGGVLWNHGSEPRKYFDVRDVDDLTSAFDGNVVEDTDCNIDLTMQEGGPPEPAQIPLVTIELDGVDVPYVIDCENDEGWTWIEEGLILTFCGTYCEKFKVGSPVEGTYGCPPPN